MDKEKIKNFLESLYLGLPNPLSKLAYSLARSTIFKDIRQPFFEMAFRQIVTGRLGGDYLEFGVYCGASLITSWRLAKKFGLGGMRFFAFDSFMGLPEAEGPLWKPGMYSCSRERFEKIIKQAGVDVNRVVIVEGLYDDTLNAATKRRYQLEKAAVIHIDCDLYISTVAALSFIEDLIEVGSILLFDDWMSFDGSGDYGEPRAFSEWPQSHRFREFYTAGRRKGFICTDGSQ